MLIQLPKPLLLVSSCSTFLSKWTSDSITWFTRGLGNGGDPFKF